MSNPDLVQYIVEQAGENSSGELANQAKQNINSFHFIAQMLAYSK